MEVIVTRQAEKQLVKLPKTERKKVQRKLLLIESSPLSGKKLSAEFEGKRSLKAWPYRIIYSVDTQTNKIFILSILHRQGAYKK